MPRWRRKFAPAAIGKEIALLLTAIQCLFGVAAAKDEILSLYVAPNGDNTHDGRTEAGLGDWVSPHSNFTGTFWGVCCQDMSDRSVWADFNHFDYQPHE